MRKLRGGGQKTFSLFAFQDIMIAVMGVLILVTLILALELTDASDAYAESADRLIVESKEPDVDADKERRIVMKLLSERSKLEAKHQEIIQQAKDIVELNSRSEGEANEILDEINAFYGKIEELNQQVADRKAKLAERSDLNQAMMDRIQAINKLKQRSMDLEEEIRSRKRNPRLTYTIGRETGKRAVLIELNESSISIGPAEDTRSITTFRGSSKESLVKQFENAIKLYSPTRDYFFLLIRPVAFGEFQYHIEDIIKKHEFQMGREIILEEEVAFPDAAR